ncbi:hypothetical protein BKA64DRAFT_751813, partial [Cadophora sp. MPI-SDFR-AT-0126]
TKSYQSISSPQSLRTTALIHPANPLATPLRPITPAPPLIMAPYPLCCSSAIPSTFCYLAHLLSKQTTHAPLTRFKSSIPILTSFLVHLSTMKVSIPDTTPDGYSPIFYFIIQVKSHSLDQKTRGMSTGMGTSRPALSPTYSSSTSLLSTPKQLPPRRTSNYRSIQNNNTGTSHPSPRYFVPHEPLSLNPANRLFSPGFREIATREAMESLRFPGSGIEIGDGEEWRELEEVERLWYWDHGVGFELRVWVREEGAVKVT